MNADVKYLVPRNLVYADVDKHVFDFFNRARSKNMPVSIEKVHLDDLNVYLHTSDT